MVFVDHEMNLLSEPVSMLVNPGIPIPPKSTETHGITDEMVKNAPMFADIAQQLFDALDPCDWLFYNGIKFDVPLLMAELARCNIHINPHNRLLIDGYVTFSKKEPRDLSSALKFYTGEVMENAHEASSDIMATVKVVKGQLDRYSDIESVEDMFSLTEPETRCDIAGKFIVQDGVPVFAFGKHFGEPISSQAGMLKWMLDKDFPQDTKDFITKYMNENGIT